MTETTKQPNSQGEELGKQDNDKPKRDEKGRLLPGNTANPSGRPIGYKTIKTRVREYLEANPESMDKFVKFFAEDNRNLAWQMLEGKPPAKVDLGVDKEDLKDLTNFFKNVADWEGKEKND